MQKTMDDFCESVDALKKSAEVNWGGQHGIMEEHEEGER